MHLHFLVGNTFNAPMDKGNGSGYAIGQGICSDSAFNLGKVAKIQSLGDALCEATLNCEN
jgi:hypothetical protein